MYKFIKMRMVQSTIVLIVFLFTVSTGWSSSELLLTLQRWKFQVQPRNYLVRFTIQLSSGYERPIERIDAFLSFKDKFGNDLEKVYINQYVTIQPGKYLEKTWTYIINPFSPMMNMKPADIRVKLAVRGITFSTGERMAFTIGSGVIY
ncbi:MAG: hypothetical protein JSV14_01565 [Deltaproteobacteria bacterium]|nr:MAG: hypothetical protein JSV14_01565 [Deltaproteobacteria bacterium]